MKFEDIAFWSIIIALVSLIATVFIVSTISVVDIGFAQNQTELNKTGYVTDIEFISGGLFPLPL